MKLRHVSILLAISFFTTVMAACSDDGEPIVSPMRPATAAQFAMYVDGKGWKHVESHEIKAGGSLARQDYWDGLTGGVPAEYAFGGDSVTTYMYVDAYPINGYKKAEYSYDGVTGRVTAGGKELFIVAGADAGELRIVKCQSMRGDGRKVYVYSVYRAMSPGELAACTESHPYNLDTFDEMYPTLPEQELVTAADFTRHAVGYVWKCSEVHAAELPGRYAADTLARGGNGAAPCDYYISADSIESRTDAGNGATVRLSASGYTFRANSFYVAAGHDGGFRVISINDSEMHILMRQAPAGGGSPVPLYCIYRKAEAGDGREPIMYTSMRQ